MSRQAVSDALAMLKGMEKVGKQAAKLQADVLEKAVEGTPIQGPLKSVRAEVESVLSAVESRRPEVESRFSETLSQSIDSSAAAAQQVKTFTDSATQQAQDAAQQATGAAQSTAQEAFNKLNNSSPPDVADFANAAQSAAQTAQSTAQEAFSKLSASPPPGVAELAGAAQMAAQTAQATAQEAIEKFNSVAPQPVVDLASAATAQAAAIFENFQKMAMNGPIAASMGSPSAASPVEDDVEMGAAEPESESDAIIREEMAKWEAEVAKSAAASPPPPVVEEIESTGDPETDRLLEEEIAKFNAAAAQAAGPPPTPIVEELDSTGDPETDRLLAEELAKFNADAAAAAAGPPPKILGLGEPQKREFSTWASPTIGAFNRLSLLSHRYNGAFAPVKYPALSGVLLRQLFQGGRGGGGGTPLLQSITATNALTSPSSWMDTSIPSVRIIDANPYSSDSGSSETARPARKGSSTGLKAGIKPPPKASELKLKKHRPKLSDVSQEKRVPTGRVERLASYTGLAAGLAVGGLAEMTKRAVGLGGANANVADASVLLNPANAERIVNTLCRVRGAALKLGQMLSIADNSLISPELQGIFDRVRQGADFMPWAQTESTLKAQLGNDWRDKVAHFDEKPFAAASIGQVHMAELHNGQQLAVKIQYPGVADGIDSDINNLVAILNATRLVPDALFLDELVRVARKELAWEVNYVREKEASNHFRQLLANDPVFYVPEVNEDLSSSRVLTTEFLEGVPLDAVSELECLETRNLIGEAILRLTLTELFVWRCMQTDPNWSNFLFCTEKSKIGLIDFGASRYFTTKFVDDYVKIINSAALGDKDGILHWSKEVGFITGYEAKTLLDAHVDAIMILGEAFQTDAPFDFGNATTLARVTNILPAILTHRLAAPPEEVYSLHRKMAGVFLLCTRLKCNMNIKHLWDEIWARYEFGRPDLPEALAQNSKADVKSVSGK